jgi:peptidoglycan/xylan/chitin deacetylase (PgdA/CDA1 family)
LRHPAAQPAGIRILFYHRVSDDRDDLAVGTRRFEEQMALLAEEGYRVVDVAEAARLLAEERVPEKVIGLSFDDGYLDVVENAGPVLDRHGFRATMFVVTGALDGRVTFSWYRRQPPLLGWDTVVRLDSASPFRFDAHTITHPDLRAVPPAVARDEIARSKTALEERLGRPVDTFCYPAGLFGERERALVAQAGFRAATSCEPGVNAPGDDLLTLRRTGVERRDSLLDFRAKLAGAHDEPLPFRTLYRRVRYRSGDLPLLPPDERG